jgi:hypothetical protein
MRSPRLVVRYLEAAPPQVEGLEYAGVFLADDDVDSVYAQAEPPTHDDWSHEQLSTPADQSLVRRTLRELKRIAADFARPAEAATATATEARVGALATQLGSLVLVSPPAADAPAGRALERRVRVSVETPEPRANSSTVGANGEGRPTATRSMVGQPRLRTDAGELAVRDGIGVFVVPFHVKRGAKASGFRLTARVRVVLPDGSEEGGAPAGAELPTVLGWYDAVGASLNAGAAELEVLEMSQLEGTVVVRLIDDACMRVSIVAESIDGAGRAPTS